MKRTFFVGFISALSLTACGGGGSSTPAVPAVIYPMSGTYIGTLATVNGVITNFGISVANNGPTTAGTFAITDPASGQAPDNTWNESIGRVNNNTLDVDGGVTVENVKNCRLHIRADLVSANELDGSMTLSNCGDYNFQVPFTTFRQMNLQTAARKVPA